MWWLELVKFFAPIILAKINPHVAQVSDSIVKGITEAQQIPGASNEDQLSHAVGVTNAAVEAINKGTGKQLIDPKIVADVAPTAISLIVDITKKMHNSSVNINK